jgi:hypothetical protein
VEFNLPSAYLDDELSTEEIRAFDGHLTSCPDCRLELAGLRETKRRLALLPRQPLPTGLAAELHSQLYRPASWTRFLLRFLTRPRIWVPAGAFATATLLLGLFWGHLGRDSDSVPIEPLLAAHNRYSAETLLPQEALVTANYSSQINSYYARPEQETE